jgi:SAM-dependent methyltransferase
MDIDDPRTTLLRRQIIQSNRFLNAIYLEWYQAISLSLPPGDDPVLELGSGAGFLSDFIPGLITSEIFSSPSAALVMDAHTMPFQDSSLRGIVMTNVLHHLARPRCFFAEAARCVKPGGVMVMIEPWVTAWGKFIYTHLHHEPFVPDASCWEFPQTGPLSGANGALPWILFVRDREQFEQEFPMWQVHTIRPTMPFRYLVSGGVSRRALMPSWSFSAWRTLENCMRPWLKYWGMFAQITLSHR